MLRSMLVLAVIACLGLGGCASLDCDSMRGDGMIQCTRERGP